MLTNYAEFLHTMLSSTGLFHWKPGSYALADLEALGGALDLLAGELEALERESMPDSAAGEGLLARRALFPFLPQPLSPASLRAALAALQTVGDASFSRGALCAALAGCGLPAVVRETDKPQTVRVEFPGIPGVPAGFDSIRAVVEALLPAHVDVEYLFWYAAWRRWEELNPTWQAWEERGLSWEARELEVE